VVLEHLPVRVRAEPVGDLGGADVAGLPEHVLEIEHAVGMRITDQLARHLEAATLAVEVVLERDCAGLQGRRHQEYLEGRARLVGVEQRTRARRLVGRSAEAVRVEERPLREREHVAGPRVEGDDHAAGGAGLLHGFVEGGFGVGLEGRVERELDVATHRRGGIDLLGEEDAAASIALHGQRARRAAQERIFLLLDPADARAIDVREAEQVGCERAVGVDPARLLDESDAFEPERPHLLGLLRRHPTCDVGEGTPLCEPLRHAPRVGPEHARQRLRRGGGILQYPRHREDARRLDRDRQLPSPAVGDLAALRREADLRLHLPLAVLGAAMVDERQMGRSCGHRQQTRAEHDPHHVQALGRAAQVRRSRAAVGSVDHALQRHETPRAGSACRPMGSLWPCTSTINRRCSSSRRFSSCSASARR
jgi:hypothetical protein